MRLRAWLALVCAGSAASALAQANPPAPAAVERPEYYVVKRGDSLSAIARRYGLEYRELARWNGISDPSRIEVGQRLRLTPANGSASATATAAGPGTTAGAPSATAAPAGIAPSSPSPRAAVATAQTNRTLPPGAAAQPIAPGEPGLEAASTRQERELAQLRATTATLIELLLAQDLITREKAESLMQQAQLGPLPPADEIAAGKSAARAAPQPASVAPPADAAVEATAQPTAPQPEPGVVRVPYVPEVVKNEIRDQVREEVIAQAKAERWAEPSALPEWLDRITWEGDFRLRLERDNFDSGNTPASTYALDALSGVTRAAGFAATDGGIPTGNTTDDEDSWKVRLRLGLLARVSDKVAAAARITTGNTENRVSTNQSLGDDLNKFSLVLDRAYVRVEPWSWLTLLGGRMPNPWFATDLQWDEDLNFDGIAASVRPISSAGRALAPFFTAGAFPLREDSPPSADARWLYGAQAGLQWDVSSETRLKFGLGYYSYSNIAGQQQSSADFLPGFGPLTASYDQYEYPSSLRQKGNSLFRTNAPNDLTGETIWGLASEFRPLSLMASLDLAQFEPVKIGLYAEYVENLGFDRQEILSRTGVELTDGGNNAYQLRLNVGRGTLREPNDWQAFLAYKHIESDSVLDGFADSDFGLGGTNLKGYVLGVNYTLYPNTFFTLRGLFADEVDPFTLQPGDKFGVDVFQLDFNARF
jgi:murein DD-endopeptidase MepM/ murein hydrolase activator NlpD